MQTPPSKLDPSFVLIKLNELKPLKHNPSINSLDRKIKRATTLMLLIGFFLVLVLCFMAAIHQGFPLSELWITVAISAGAFAQFFLVLGLILQVGNGILNIPSSYKNSARDRVAECSHDHKATQDLLAFDVESLLSADLWLEKRIKRAERRLGRFFGGSDKIALFAVVGMAWVTWGTVSAEITSLTPSPVLFGVATLAGVLLGGVAWSFELERLHYQRDLLSVAMRTSSANTSR